MTGECSDFIRNKDVVMLDSQNISLAQCREIFPDRLILIYGDSTMVKPEQVGVNEEYIKVNSKVKEAVDLKMISDIKYLCSNNNSVTLISNDKIFVNLIEMLATNSGVDNVRLISFEYRDLLDIIPDNYARTCMYTALLISYYTDKSFTNSTTLTKAYKAFCEKDDSVKYKYKRQIFQLSKEISLLGLSYNELMEFINLIKNGATFKPVSKRLKIKTKEDLFNLLKGVR